MSLSIALDDIRGLREAIGCLTLSYGETSSREGDRSFFYVIMDGISSQLEEVERLIESELHNDEHEGGEGK